MREIKMAMSLERREETAQKRRMQILDASLILFDQKGYVNTTMSEVAEKAGISKGLIYRYFPSKKDILLAYGDAVEECQTEILNMPTPTDSLVLIAEWFLLEYDKTGHQPPLRVLLMNLSHGDLAEEEKSKEYLYNYGKTFIGPIIRQGQLSGEFRKGDPERMGDIFWHMLLGYAVHIKSDQAKNMTESDIYALINLIRAEPCEIETDQ